MNVGSPVIHGTSAPKSASSAWWLGLGLAGALAAVGMTLAEQPWVQHVGLSALSLAVIFGMVAGNTFFPAIAPRVAAGVDFSRTTLLRAGIVLYGFRITFQQISSVGWAGVVIDVLMVGLTFVIAVRLGTRVFGLDRETSMLIGAGSAICGAAAVVATEPVVRGQPHKVSVAVATVVVFGTLAMFAYPLAYRHLGLSEQAYGVYVGSTVHEVAHVVAAAKNVSDAAAATAVVEKMLRVMMLAPFLVLLSGNLQRRRAEAHSSAPITIPWFAVLFIVASGLNSLHVLPEVLVSHLVQIDTLLLTMAMAALGLRTHAEAVRRAGVRPVMLAASLFVFLTVGGYGVNRLITYALG